MLEWLFITISAILTLFLISYKTYICKLERTPAISVFVSAITGTMLLYVLSAAVLTVTITGIFNKLIILSLGLSPFIIGKMATYEKENLYCYIQILIIVFGIIYLLL
ncbi:hypothetical protein IJ750_06695 [bacterium]|nr:hypothetical protein [bacterium]